MDAKRDQFYLHTAKKPSKDGFLPLDPTYRLRLKPKDGLWLVGEEAIFYRVSSIDEEGVFLNREDAEHFPHAFGDAPFGRVESGGFSYHLPAMRQTNALMPTGNPFAVEVEHKDDESGPGEMVIELYSKEGDGYIKQSTDDDLESFLAQSLETLLKVQLQTLESTAEIGDLWIKYLQYKKRRNHRG